MPTYEYECRACGHHFENFQSMSSEPIKKCPKCGKKTVKRLISGGAGLIFKGSGFYITDYRDSSYSEKAKADDGSAKPDTGAKTEGGSKTEGETAKPAASDATSAPAASAKDSKPAAESKPKSEPKPPPKTASKSASKSRSKS